MLNIVNIILKVLLKIHVYILTYLYYRGGELTRSVERSDIIGLGGPQPVIVQKRKCFYKNFCD